MALRHTNQFTDVAEVYDDLMSVVPYGRWVEYVQSLWQAFGFAPRRVLDLACGTGSVLAELARQGYGVEGADLSAGMLAVARRKNPRVRLWHQDARELSLPGPPFDACVCLFDSLNYILEPEGLRQAFAAVHRHLEPGGVFVFDMNAIRALEAGMFNQKGTGRDARLSYEWHSRYDPETRLCRVEMEFQVKEEDPDGQARTRLFHEVHMQRGYTAGEITGGLRDAGFSILGIYQAFSMRLPTANTDRYHVIARAEPLSREEQTHPLV